MSSEKLDRAMDIGSAVARFLSMIFDAIKGGHLERVDEIIGDDLVTHINRIIAEAEAEDEFGLGD